MRTKPWLVVVYVGSQIAVELSGIPILSRHAGIGVAEGAPIAAAPVSDAVHGRAPVLTETSPQLTGQELVKVRVYTSTNLTAAALRAALNVAQATFLAASVDVGWTVCGPLECGTPPAADELIVRFVRSPQGRGHDVRCLGDAMIDAEKGTGVLATVYIERVFDLARQLEIDHRILLGRTIAHEIGHLLLATNTHSPSGLMREIWSQRELRAGRWKDWALHAPEVAAIRQRLAVSRGIGATPRSS